MPVYSSLSKRYEQLFEEGPASPGASLFLPEMSIYAKRHEDPSTPV